MEVKNKSTDDTVEINILDPGDLFYYNDSLWLLLDDYTEDDLIKAVVLKTGEVTPFNAYDRVSTVSYNALEYIVDRG